MAGSPGAPLAQVSSLRNPAEQASWERLQHPRLTQLWTGFFDLGLALARGNARTDTFTTALTASRTTRNDKITTYFNQIHGTARVQDVTSTIASAVRGGWSYERNFSPRMFVSTLNDYEHDGFQSLNLRFVAGGGVGVHAIRSDSVHLSLLGSGDYSHESFTRGLSRNSAEAMVGDDLVWKPAGATTVTQALRVFPNLSRGGEYRINFDLSAVTAVKKWLGWHVTASDRFLSDPVFGRQRNDILLSTGFRLSFAR